MIQHPEVIPLVLLCATCAVFLGGPVVMWFLGHVESPDPDGIELPGGRWIGLLERAAAFSASICSCWCASSRARSTRMAASRFCSWDFSFCMETTIPVGTWVMRTAESVVFKD